MPLTEQIAQVQQQILDEKNKGAERNSELISILEQQEADLLHQIMVEDQESAAQLRIQDATEQAAYFLDNLVIEGMTMRELCAGEAEYQVLKISVQNKIITMAEESSRLLSESQAEDVARQNELKKKIEVLQSKADEESREAAEDHETIRQLRTDLSQSQLERNDFESKLKNATNEIERLESQVDDLRKEIAVGARNAYKVTDVEQVQQLKQLADQIKANRIHVYDVVPDNYINAKNYTAKRADNGEEVTYNWTQAKNYIEIKDSEEVERFRQQFASQNAVQDLPLDEQVTDIVAPDLQFPDIPTAEALELPTLSTELATGQPEAGAQGQVTREEFEALKKRVVELETVCNVSKADKAVA